MAEESKSINKSELIVIGLIVVLVAVVLFNQYQILGLKGSSLTGAAIATTTATTTTSTGSATQVALSSVVPTGVPAVYGKELGIKYDDVSSADPQKADATINKLSQYDRSTNLEGDKLQRYIAIASQISCEYCCGAQSIIFSNGNAACSCAHSYAMRGLAKYLLTNHADMTNDQILEELGKWKTLFFPGAMQQKAGVLQQKGIELNYINLASNKYRGIEKGTSTGGMVGGC